MGLSWPETCGIVYHHHRFSNSLPSRSTSQHSLPAAAQNQRVPQAEDGHLSPYSAAACVACLRLGSRAGGAATRWACRGPKCAGLCTTATGSRAASPAVPRAGAVYLQQNRIKGCRKQLRSSLYSAAACVACLRLGSRAGGAATRWACRGPKRAGLCTTTTGSRTASPAVPRASTVHLQPHRIRGCCSKLAILAPALTRQQPVLHACV